MKQIPQNSTYRFKIFMADAADITEGKTGLVGSFTVTLAKDGLAEQTVSPTITERGQGWYEVTPIAANRDTLGENAWTFKATGSKTYPYKEEVVAVDARTARFGAAAAGDQMNLADNAITAAKIVAAALNGKGDWLTTLGATAPAGWINAASIVAAALNGKGDWSTASQVSSLQVNTRANLHVPVEIETPDSGTQIYKIRLHLYDVEGNMEAPDSTPTIALTNAAGTNRASRLSAATVVSTGVYSWDYTATAGDAEEQLVWIFTVVEGGITRTYPATSYVVEETAYRFSSSDRNNLNLAVSQTAAAAVRASVGLTAANLEALLSAIDTVVDAIKLHTDRHATMIEADGPVWRYTTNALEQAPAGGGGGGGDATLANQTTMINLLNSIKTKTDTIGIVTVSATGYAQLIDGVLTLKEGHTATLTFTGGSPDIVPDLTGQKCFFGIKDTAGRTWISIEGTVTTPTGTQVLTFNISASEAAKLYEGEHYFDVVCIYGYNPSLTPPYTGLRVFTSGRCTIDRLNVDIP